MQTFFHALNVDYYYVSPLNHGSLRAERYIRTLNDSMMKHLEGTADLWPLYVQPCCFTMNCQISLVTGYSPFEMVHCRKPPKKWKWEFNPDDGKIKLGTIRYMDVMKHRCEFMDEMITKRKTWESQSEYIKEIRRNPDHRTFQVCELVYFYFPSGAKLQAPSRKLKHNWIGPLRIMTILDDTHYLIGDMEGKLPDVKVHFHRLKPYHLNLNEINEIGLLNIVTNYTQLMEKWRILIQDELLVKEWQTPNTEILALQ